MAKLSLARGPIIAAIGLIVVVLGANLFDTSYRSVESVIGTTSSIFTDKEILPNQFINSTIASSHLQEHNVIVVHVIPSSGSVKLEGIDPNGMTFEKDSSDGFLYHIIQRSPQGGAYDLKILDTGDQSVRINAVIGEDPFLGNSCSASYGMKCNIVHLAVGMVATGIVAFVVGIGIGMYDFKNEQKLQKK
ncbi:MAG: hypothetical protein PXX83_07285 [Candidatus Nitrosotalea sp.]|nr:hypothetical protein [Candidatus Nitrosotalea sp.]